MPTKTRQKNNSVYYDKRTNRFSVLSPCWFNMSPGEVFVFGDLMTDKKICEQLNKADKQKNFQCGDCNVLASTLSYQYKLPISEVIVNNERMHTLVRLPNGQYLDSLGLWTEKGLLQNWNRPTPQDYIYSLALCGAEDPFKKESPLTFIVDTDKYETELRHDTDSETLKSILEPLKKLIK